MKWVSALFCFAVFSQLVLAAPSPTEVWSSYSGSGITLLSDSGSVPHLVWKGCSSNNSCRVYYANYSKASGEFNSPRPVSVPSDSVSGLTFFFTGGVYRLLWVEGASQKALMHSYSTDGGYSWSARNPAFAKGLNGFSAAGLSSGLGIAWSAGDGARASVLGSSWSDPVLLDSGASSSPSIVSSNSSYFIVWERGGEVYYSREGSSKKPVSSTVGASESPIALNDSSGGVNIVWRDAGSSSGASGSDWNIYFTRLPKPGEKIDVSSSQSSSESPLLSLDASERLHVVWTEGAGELVHSLSRDMGGTWEARQIASSSSAPVALAVKPDLNDFLHLLWAEGSVGGQALYYSYFNGSEWATAQQLASGDSIDSAGLCFDEWNDVHVAYIVSGSGSSTLYHTALEGSGVVVPHQFRVSVSGNCTNQPVFAEVKGIDGYPVPNAGVTVSIYDDASFTWSEIASGLTSPEGIFYVFPSREGYYRFDVSKPQFVSQAKHQQVDACAGAGCYSKEDCPFDFVCISGACSPPECSHDSDCLPTESCAEGVCVELLYCESSADCEEGMECIANSCVRPCESDSDCPDDEECYANTCQPVQQGACGYVSGHEFHEYACCSPRDCFYFETCVAHACVNIDCECGVIQDHECVPHECCSKADCAQGEYCFDHSCALVLSNQSVLVPVPGTQAPKIVVEAPLEAVEGAYFQAYAKDEYGKPVKDVGVDYSGTLVFTDSSGKADVLAHAVGEKNLTFSKTGYVTASRQVLVSGEPQQLFDFWGMAGACAGVAALAVILFVVAFVVLGKKPKVSEKPIPGAAPPTEYSESSAEKAELLKDIERTGQEEY